MWRDHVSYLWWVLTSNCTLSSLLRRMGRALVSTDPLQPADALVVLAGEARSDRSDEAARLVRLEYARYLILCSSMESNELMKRRCIAKGVPESQIVCGTRDYRRWSTRDEADIAVGLLEELNCRAFILVTTDFHTARARRVFESRLRDNSITMLVHGSRDYYMSTEEWWRNRHGLARVPREIAKTFVYRFALRC